MAESASDAGAADVPVGAYRVHLSPPHLGANERAYLNEALEANWVAPAGPHLRRFEEAFAAYVGAPAAVAVASGTAALHLALRLAGVEAGAEVLCPDMTFVATANPILYEKAVPVLIDCEAESWNIDPALVEQALVERARAGKLPGAVVVAHVYGQSADLQRLAALCEEYGVALIEDAAESLGAHWNGRHPGTVGAFGAYSFNGNKIVTTGGGGMLVCRDPAVAARARHLASQARCPGSYYEHDAVGYNYRLSNILAAIGLGQLEVLDERVARCRRLFERYREGLGELPGVAFQPQAPRGEATRWLSILTLEPEASPVGRDAVLQALEAARFEARSLWRPLHQQKMYAGCPAYLRGVGERLFTTGVCLPSSTLMSDAEQDEIIAVVRGLFPAT